MNVTVEFMDGTQFFYYPHHALHRVIGIVNHPGTQEKSFDIIAAIKLDGKFHQFADAESSSTQIIAAAVDAIGAIVNAVIGEHNFE